ncbi:MAG: imelysin family protein [Rhodobacteraceae bacterium]|nr:imelysin family protein [Paracoccaceae bacterium]
MKHLAFALIALLPVPALAQDEAALLAQAVTEHILPSYENLAEAAQVLETAALTDCTFDGPDLRAAYHDAFDAWIAVSHLRFGPSEDQNRAFAMAFWPDKKGFTAKALTALISDQDPIVDTPEQYSEVSIAGRGFFALDMLMFDPRYLDVDADYTCRLLRAITTDISIVSDGILGDWQSEYATYMLTAGSDTNPVYFTPAEGVQELFKAVLTGLEFTQGQRLSRPMGTFDRPRATRAEAWRSGRSSRNVVIALNAAQELSEILTSYVSGGVAQDANARLAYAVRQAERLDDPVFAGVADPSDRFKVEAVQTSIIAAYDYLVEELGPALGVNPGFNALDGD